MNSQDFVKQNYDAINQDKFFRTDYGFEEVYYNPDSTAGGQLVYNEYPYSLIREAVKTGSVKAFYNYLSENCKQYSVDIDHEDFISYATEFINKKAEHIGTGKETAYAMIIAADCALERKRNNDNRKMQHKMRSNI